MFLPIGDSPNPRGTPLVNYALIAINVAIYLLVAVPLSGKAVDPSDPALAQYIELIQGQLDAPHSLDRILREISAYDLLLFRWGFRPIEGSLLTLFSSMFLHGSFMHLAGNMLFLWIYGDNVEERLGKLGYLVAYLGCGAAATLSHAVFDLGSGTPMVGASGAISGALGFYFLFFPHNRVKLLIAFFPLLVRVVMVPARLVLGFYLLIDNLLPFLVTRGNGGGGVAYGAHIGGFVAGLGAAWFLDRRERASFPRGYRTPDQRTQAAKTIGALVAAGRHADAADVLFGGGAVGEVGPLDLLELADWLHAGGHADAALAAYRRVLTDHRTGSLAARAHTGLGEVLFHGLGRPASAWQHYLDAIDLDPRSVSARTAREGLRRIEALRGGRGR